MEDTILYVAGAEALGDMAAKARQRDILSRWGTRRVVAWNLGIATLWPGLGLGVPALIATGAVLFGGALVSAIALLVTALTSGARSSAGRLGT